MNPGIYRGLSNAEYHGGAGISKSGLDLIHRTPAHYHAVVTAANDNAPTPAQMIGTAFHCMILEPQEFIKNYCAPLSQSDVPDAIADRDKLVAIADEINAATDAEVTATGVIRKADELISIINDLNISRLPKLSTSGTKTELIRRITDATDIYGREYLEEKKAPDLKTLIDLLNVERPGLLSTSGTLDQLAQTVRDAGVDVLLLRDVMARFKNENGFDFFIDTKASMPELAAAIRAAGKPVVLWSEVKEEWLRNNGHRTVLTNEQYEQLRGMRESVMRHPAASALLTTANNVVVDVKTTEDASPEGFAKSIANWRYHTQHPFYLDGLREAIRQGNITELPKGEAEVSAYWVDDATGELCRCRPDFWRGSPDNFVFLAVEKKAPYAVGVYLLDADSVALGRAEYRADLNLYAQCKSANVWPAYSDSVQAISVPQWQFAQAALRLQSAA
jgi:hypothetical protein